MANSVINNGNTGSNDDYARIKRMYIDSIPRMVANRSIAQSIAINGLGSHTISDRGFYSGRGSVIELSSRVPRSNAILSSLRTKEDNVSIDDRNWLAYCKAAPSENVVRAHLTYMYKYEPFRHGEYNMDTLYGFLYFMVIERKLKISYTMRVLKSILAYVRSKAEESVASSTNTDQLFRMNDSFATLSNNRFGYLTNESKVFLLENARGPIVKLNRFYQTINSISDSFGEESLKRTVVESRSKRPLVFTEHEEMELINVCIETLLDLTLKYIGNDFVQVWRQRRKELHTIITDRKVIETKSTSTRVNTDEFSVASVTNDRTLFEFSTAFLLGFLTGARVKSVILRLRVTDIDDLMNGKRVEFLTKGAFAVIFLPPQLLNNSDLYGNDDPSGSDITSSSSPDNNIILSNCLDSMQRLRSTGPLYEKKVHLLQKSSDDTRYFTRTDRQLELCLDRFYRFLFGKRRERGVRWHSQRRCYLGEISKKCGILTASKSVGHSDVATTMLYYNKSQHQSDTANRAGRVITDKICEMTKL